MTVKYAGLRSILAIVLVMVFIFYASIVIYAEYSIPILDNVTFPPLPPIEAPSAILLDLERGQVLYHKKPEEKLHISTANKIMTAVLTIEKISLDTKVTISKESIATEGTVLYLSVGGKYAAEELLNAIIVTNANDATNALAEHLGGSINGFVDMMNKKAADLGMKNTRFANPTGLFDETQYTTAIDLGILMRYAITLADFNRIFSYRAVPWADHQGVELLTNLNKLFWSYEGIDGGKTGFNRKDMQTSITTASKNSRRLLAIVLDAPENTVFTDSQTLLDFGFENYKRSVLVTRNQPLHNMVLANTEISLISNTDIYYVHPIGDDYVVNIEFSLISNLELPLATSRLCGIARYTLRDKTVIDINLYSDREVHPPETFFGTFMDRIKEHRDLYILILVLSAFALLLFASNMINYVRKRLRDQKKNEQA